MSKNDWFMQSEEFWAYLERSVPFTAPIQEDQFGMGPVAVHTQLIADFRAIETLRLEILTTIAERSKPAEYTANRNGLARRQEWTRRLNCRWRF